MTDVKNDHAKRCKRCKKLIEDEDPIWLHGRFPLHGKCYQAVIQS